MYDDTGADSGYTIHRAFCGKCGSALYSYPESAPDAVFVKVRCISGPNEARKGERKYGLTCLLRLSSLIEQAGVLDELARVKPAAEIVSSLRNHSLARSPVITNNLCLLLPIAVRGESHQGNVCVCTSPYLNAARNLNLVPRR